MMFVSSAVAGEIKNIESLKVKAGYLGLVGNKGTVSVKFDYKEKSFAFSCGHLEAGDDNLKARISQMNDLKKSKFKKDTSKKLKILTTMFFSET